MVITNFQVEDKVSKPIFFQETFSMADTKIEMIQRMLLLKLSNTDVLFGNKTLT